MVESLTKEPPALKRSLKNFKEALTYNHLKRGNLNWYFNCYKVIKNKLFFIPYMILKKILVAHILEELNMEDTLSVLNYIISPAYRMIIRERQSDPTKYDNELVFDGLMKEYYEAPKGKADDTPVKKPRAESIPQQEVVKTQVINPATQTQQAKNTPSNTTNQFKPKQGIDAALDGLE